MATRTLKVDYIARVEGESSLDLHIRNGTVEAASLSIFEPPRFFEALLRGRGFGEVLDIVARICGICPVAYQMSAVHAIEGVLGIEVGEPIRALRRLLYCGEWIESHALHIVMLHAPDFLGYPDAIAMARDHREAVERGLALKKTGNELLRLLGGREIHPVNVRVGGFLSNTEPRRADAARRIVEAKPRLGDRDIALGGGLSVSRCHPRLRVRRTCGIPEEYPMNAGRIVSSAGLDIAAADYESEFVERQVPYSTALHSQLKQRGAYLVGPMARYALSTATGFPAEVQALADEAGLEPVCRNPFRSILVRAVEIVYACGEALRIDRRLRPAAAALCFARAARWCRLCVY